MLTRYADENFLSFLDWRGIALAETDAKAATAAMADWYRTTRARDAARLEHGGDTLEVLWETRAVDGIPWFEYACARVLTVPRASGGDSWRVVMAYRYEATELTAALRFGMHTCDVPAALPWFLRRLEQSLPAVFAKVATPAHTEVRFGRVGDPSVGGGALTSAGFLAAS